MKNIILILFILSVYILMSEQQANDIRGTYGVCRELNPVYSPGADSYALPVEVLNDTNFNSVIPLLQGYGTMEMTVEEFWQEK